MQFREAAEQILLQKVLNTEEKLNPPPPPLLYTSSWLI